MVKVHKVKPKKSQPHIDPAVLTAILKLPIMSTFHRSMVFTPEFHNYRLLAVRHRDSVLKCYNGDSRTWLHFAVILGDILLAVEALRLGVPIDKVDDRGRSPLFYALEELTSTGTVVMIPIVKGRPLNVLTNPIANDPTHWNRIEFIAKCLIEQHADVNITVNNITPLQLAYRAKTWDLVELLIIHGARVRPDTFQPRIPGLSTSEISRLTAMAQSFENRPLRLCPCFSGKPLSLCHIKEQPYPGHFQCFCESQKPFSACCIDRHISVTEIWEESQQWIRPKPLRSLPGVDEPHDLYFIEPQPGTPERGPFDLVTKHTYAVCDAICEIGLADPAVAYAFKKYDGLPCAPAGRTLPKNGCRKIQTEWNDLIDEYIAHPNDDDHRSPAEITRASKIGITLGAFYRHCDGVDCKIEEDETRKLRSCCAKCQIACFCSKECFKRSWDTHKLICGTRDQREKKAPALIDFDKYLLPRIEPEPLRGWII